VRYWTTLGGPRKIRKLRAEEGIPTPLCRSRGVVEAPDLVTREKAVVLRNASSRYNVEVADFSRATIYAEERKGTHKAWRFFERLLVL
jgi:hypothetical protein